MLPPSAKPFAGGTLTGAVTQAQPFVGGGNLQWQTDNVSAVWSQPTINWQGTTSNATYMSVADALSEAERVTGIAPYSSGDAT